MTPSSEIEEVTERFPFVACAYARALAESSDAFRRQLEPDVRELEDDEELGPDPFDEEGEASGCFGLKQRFPDRVLVMTSNACFMNCRHCTRKGLLRHAEVVRSDEELAACAAYVQEHPLVRDVLLSGGDPLVLPDVEVMRFVRAFAALPQVDVVRLCTRVPCVNPARVTRDLAALLGRGLALVSCVVDPEIYVIGGGMSKAGPMVIDYVQKYYVEAAFHASTSTRFALAELGNDAGMYGCVKMVQDKIPE